MLGTALNCRARIVICERQWSVTGLPSPQSALGRSFIRPYSFHPLGWALTFSYEDTFIQPMHCACCLRTVTWRSLWWGLTDAPVIALQTLIAGEGGVKAKCTNTNTHMHMRIDTHTHTLTDSVPNYQQLKIHMFIFLNRGLLKLLFPRTAGTVISFGCSLGAWNVC